MPHKLLIDVEFENPSRYKKFLFERETVNGKKITIKHTVKNIGDEIFPKRNYRCKLIMPTGMGTLAQTGPQIKAPALKPKETFKFDMENIFIAPGFWLLNITVELKDKEEIEYYREEEEETPDKEKWELSFYVADRHLLDLNLNMRKLLKQKEG